MAEQEQTLDLQAMMKAKEHMGEFAGRTVGLGLVVGFIFFAVLLGFVTNYVPFFVALIFLSFATYAIYTVMHDAVHRSIQGERRDLSWLNEGLGYLAGQVLMIPFTVHRRSHLAHHAHTNEDKEDPDFSYHKAAITVSATTLAFSPRDAFDQQLLT